MDAEERKAELMSQNKMEGLMFKMDYDPRIIGSEKKDKNGNPKGIGNFIRKTSLDEFPQFWNVLKGDMSLVGTRPPTVDEWEKYELHHRSRMSIKPGITGMWQASGRSDITDFEEVVKLDTEYMHFATDYIVNLNTTNNVVVTFSLLVEKTIRKGRIFSGVYYILLGNLIAKSEYHIGRIYLLAIFIASYLIVAFTSFLPIKMIMCITFFLLVISVKATGNGIYFRRTSTIMYYTHMIVFFVLNITVNKEMYGWVGFAFCCIVTNILAYVLN